MSHLRHVLGPRGASHFTLNDDRTLVVVNEQDINA